jgi:hypothetical protein
MKRIIAFFNFWYDFIVGGDWTIAATVAWSLAAMTQLKHSYMNVWYLLPLIAFVLIATSTHRHLNKELEADTKESDKSKFTNILPNALLLPMLAVAVLPLLIFRIKYNSVTLALAWLPAALNLLVVSLFALCLSWINIARPFFSSTIALIATLLLERNNFQYDIQNFTEKVQKHPAIPKLIINCIILGIAVIILIYKICVIIKPWLNRTILKRV